MLQTRAQTLRMHGNSNHNVRKGEREEIQKLVSIINFYARFFALAQLKTRLHIQSGYNHYFFLLTY